MIHGPLKMIAIAMITQQIARGLYTVPSKTSPLKKKTKFRESDYPSLRTNTWGCIKIKGTYHIYFRSSPHPVTVANEGSGWDSQA